MRLVTNATSKVSCDITNDTLSKIRLGDLLANNVTGIVNRERWLELHRLDDILFGNADF